MRTVTTVHDYPVSPDRLWALVTDYDALGTVMRGLMSFDGLPNRRARAGDAFDLRVRLFGILPARPYRIELVQFDDDAMILQSRETGMGVRQWAHRITVTPHQGGARLTDRIDIDAGWKTPIVAAFAHHLLRRRHKPRLRLLGLV